MADDTPKLAFDHDAKAYNALVDQLISFGEEVEAFKIHDEDIFLPETGYNSITRVTSYGKHTQVHHRVLDRKVKALLAYVDSTNSLSATNAHAPSDGQGTSHHIDELRQSNQLIEQQAPMNNKVWVIHGHDHQARDVIFALLTAVGLQPLEFEQAMELTAKPSPSILEILQMRRPYNLLLSRTQVTLDLIPDIALMWYLKRGWLWLLLRIARYFSKWGELGRSVILRVFIQSSGGKIVPQPDVACCENSN